MPSGGSRKGAGRPEKFTFEKKLALANEVTMIQRDKGLSRVKAMNCLYEQLKLRPEWSNYQRYLTPKFFKQEILNILLKHERSGIISVLPTLKNKI